VAILILVDNSSAVIAKILFQGSNIGTDSGLENPHVWKAVAVALVEQCMREFGITLLITLSEKEKVITRNFVSLQL
jgi:hypothetical protein